MKKIALLTLFLANIILPISFAQQKIVCPKGEFFVNQAYSKDKYHWIVYNQSNNFGTERDWTFYISNQLTTDDPGEAINYANAVLRGLRLSHEGPVQDHEYECDYWSAEDAPDFVAVAITPSFNIEDVLQNSKKSLIIVKDKI